MKLRLSNLISAVMFDSGPLLLVCGLKAVNITRYYITSLEQGVRRISMLVDQKYCMRMLVWAF